MSKICHIMRWEEAWLRATHGLSLKHTLALWTLDLKGYEPVYRTSHGTVSVLGRNLAYDAMYSEGYAWDDVRGEWYQYGLPF